MFLGIAVLGIDISKANFDATLLDGSNTNTSAKPRHKAFPNSPATKPFPIPPPASRGCKSGSATLSTASKFMLASKPPTPTAMPSPASSTNTATPSPLSP